MPQIRPITDLRNTNEISDICHAKLEPVFITKNGYGDLVVMSIETYEQMLQVNETDNSITEAEHENAENLIDAREALATLRRKYFG
ncbi:MAG: type II toxin-antitoxin system Phd/YefM family antitoxin [Vallitaleaceae bacterium]|nr:type II toxin-antitoxin system Phd/YefM family antitoxin [Vallitaleaceae bacterium]